jgi:hypothetical protein
LYGWTRLKIGLQLDDAASGGEDVVKPGEACAL